MKTYETTTRPLLQTERIENQVLVHSHVTVPALIASCVGLMGALLVYRLGAGFDALFAGAFVWLLVFAGYEALVWRWGGKIERVFNTDLNGDGHIGEVRHLTAFEVVFPATDERGEQRILDEFGLHPEQVAEQFRSALADDAKPGRGGVLPFAQNRLSRDEWEAFMERLRVHDLARFRAGKRSNGHELTERGRLFMQQWLSEYACSVRACSAEPQHTDMLSGGGE